MTDTEQNDALMANQVDALLDNVYHHSQSIRKTTNQIIALVRADERQRIAAALLSDEAVDAMLDAAKVSGHLFPKRDPNNLPNYYDFHGQRLQACRDMNRAALTAIGISTERSE